MAIGVLRFLLTVVRQGVVRVGFAGMVLCRGELGSLAGIGPPGVPMWMVGVAGLGACFLKLC